MAYLQVKDILVHAEKLREFLRDFTRRHELKANNDLLAGLFQEVSQHEQQFKECLDEYRKDTSAELLQTWIQFDGVEDLEEAMDALSAADEQDTQSLLGQLLAAEEALQRVYELVQEQTSATKLEELFGELQQIQDHHLRNIADCVSEYGQMHRD
ncbi:hypothetical protein [Bythopirellula goksoeyrii]|uniref:Rubrerythrin n=1 Tax=Bythopirellula goksoeyrii TaxID=1400387 RepID=A0A5B9QS57_9BACT|nr:hypothetical protein [Bythopirellula goksoeyrii]QEG36951.1 hypothetical protein Pr1d_42910 [Bythopirellula goksoeyrii]